MTPPPPTITYEQEAHLLAVLSDIFGEWCCSGCRSPITAETGWKPRVFFRGDGDRGAYQAIVSILCAECAGTEGRQVQ